MTNRMLLLAIVGLVAVMIGCEKESTSPNNGVAVIEGSVSYYPPTMAIGGEADPFGFILTDYQWLSGAPTFSYSRVYVGGGIDSSYLGLRVRLSGQLEKLSAGGVETPLRHFPKVETQNIQVIR